MRATRFVMLIIASVLAIVSSITATAAFSKIKNYEGTFTDVKQNAWYADAVAVAYELGFMDGMSDTTFSPDTTVTVAQGITMACRVHAEYNNKTIAQVGGNEWYDTYVMYAKENGIIHENQFDDYTRELKRYEMAELFYDAMPDGYYNAINDVDYIPDVPVEAEYSEKLLALYNAGVVTGSDDYGTFKPDSSIVRSECAVIINRVALPENREKVNLLDFTSDDAYILVCNTTMGESMECAACGWIRDDIQNDENSQTTDFGTISDTSKIDTSALIRQLNFLSKGEIVLDTRINTYSDGAYIEYRDVKNESVYMLKVVRGKWNILGKNGKFTPVFTNNKLSPENDTFEFRITINLDTGKSTTIINGENCGTHELLSDNVFSYRVGIDEAGTGSVKMSFVSMKVNYNVYEDFEMFGADEVYGWSITGQVDTQSNQLNIKADSSAVKTFEQVDGTVCVETYFYSSQNAHFDMEIGDILTIKAVDKKLYAGQTEIYTLTPDMWYRLRVEADTQEGNAVILLNGQKKAVVSLINNLPVSKLTFKSKSEVSFDFVKVYELYEYEDYVPQPETKASMDDGIVGVNICSQWRNGTQYDKEVAESADWEIKYMVEHGVDFGAFRWCADVSAGPIKEPKGAERLHNGYQYAKYSDYMKYCILFDAQNGKHFTSDQFRKYVVPFWFENYFLDDRYMTVENQLVLAIFGTSYLSDEDYFGSVSKVRAEFDYLEEVAREYGFDGVLYFSCGSGDATYADMGFDAIYANKPDIEEFSLEVNKDSIVSRAKNENIYTIPTAFVGFDSTCREQLISPEDFKLFVEWIRNEYLTAFSARYSWAENLMWLSTWNECGDGTYILPENFNVFDYADKLRQVCTDLPIEHSDIVPTLKQKERITHRYP